ncbi:UNVERIFIED_CONTAM: hypothetical protein FKN15_023393 [Acipenser sinensis]
MLPGVGVFGTSLTARVIIPLLKNEGFSVKALWGRTQEEAEELAKEMNVPFYTNRIDDVLLHQDVDLVCINLPPPLTRQIAVKTLGLYSNKDMQTFNNINDKVAISCLYCHLYSLERTKKKKDLGVEISDRGECKAMLPGVGVFGTSLTARVIIPLLKNEGFSVKALWGRTQEEAEELAKEMNVPFYTNRIDDVLLHQDVDLVCINLPPPLTRQIAVKTLGHCVRWVVRFPRDGSTLWILTYCKVTWNLMLFEKPNNYDVGLCRKADE